MLLLAWSDGRGASGAQTASQFPFTIGRAPESHLQLESAGLWDSHARIELDRESGGFFIQSAGDAIVLLNGTVLTRGWLSLGDRIQLGGAEITFALAPAHPAPLAGREAILWVAGALIFLFEIFLAAKAA